MRANTSAPSLRRHEPGDHRCAPGWKLVEHRHVQVAEHGHRQGARYRGGGHVQDVRCDPGVGLALERRPLVDAEPVLLVDNGDSQPAEHDRILDQRMGADDDHRLARLDQLERRPSLRRRHAVGQTHHPHPQIGADVGHVDEMLGCERLGRSHQRTLAARIDGSQKRIHRHRGLARPDIALE